MKSARHGRRRGALVLLAVALALCSFGPARAATFRDLYTVSVEPDGDARDQRLDAIQRGMALLLTRITGRQQASAYPELRELIRNAERYYTSYAPVSPSEIRVGFNRVQVSQALTQLNMPIWGDERPAILVWIAADFGDGERAELRAEDQAGGQRPGTALGAASNELSEDAAGVFDEVTEEILRAADERGLPVVLPLLDSEDRRHVRFADVWGGFDQFVARAAERYQADAVAIARVAVTENGPSVDWTVLQGDQRNFLDPPRARDGIDWLADEFAARFTTIGDARPVWITIRQFRGNQDHGSLLDYLASISIIQQVDIESLTGSDLLLRVMARGDEERLLSYLTLDGRLVHVEGAAGLEFLPAWRVAPDSGVPQ